MKNAPSDFASASHRIRLLEKKLDSAKQDLIDYREFIGDRLDISKLSETINDLHPTPVPIRDDDSHYFESYGENGIE